MMESFKLSKEDYTHVLESMDDWPGNFIEPIKVLEMGDDYFGEGRVSCSIIIKKDGKVFSMCLFCADDATGELHSDNVIEYDDLDLFFPEGLVATEVKRVRVVETKDVWVIDIEDRLKKYDSYESVKYDDPYGIFNEDGWEIDPYIEED